MKSTSTCPKCGSKEIRVIDNLWARLGNTIPISNWKSAVMTNHVCTRCGYIESYITDPEKLQEIADKWSEGEA